MTSKTELEPMKQNEGEGLLQFACRLRTQALMAFGMSYTTDQIEEQVNRLSLRALGGKLGEETRKQFPESLDKSVSLARNLQTQGYTSDQPTVASGSLK